MTREDDVQMAERASIFISYDTADAAYCRDLREQLQASGLAVWMDEFDVPSDVYRPEAIEQGLAASSLVLGIMTPESAASRRVKNEWDWAITTGKPLILLRLRDCLVPHRYVSINYIDVPYLGQERALELLDQTLRAEVARAAAQPAGATQPPLRQLRPRPSGGLALFGQEQEQGRLRHVLAQALAGHGRLVLISGEAGIGKTTLANWAMHEAERQGAVTLAGRCYEQAVTPYGPWRVLLGSLPGYLADTTQHILNDESLAASGGQRAVFEQVRRLLASVATRRPLVLLLDDLQWADHASLELLRFVARALSALPLLLLATYRPAEPGQSDAVLTMLPELVREADVERLTVRSLDGAAVEAWLRQLYDLPARDARRLRDYLVARAEGNPFIAQETLQSLADDGVLRVVDGNWQLGDVTATRVPPVLRQIVGRRLAKLTPDIRQLLSLASIVGHEVELELLARVAERDENALLDAVEYLTEVGLLEVAPDGLKARFTHALIRETLYDGVNPLRRRALHRRVADALLNGRAPSPYAMAFHLDRAGDARATHWLIRAGDAALRGCALADAFAYYAKAKQLDDGETAAAGQRGWLLVRMAQTQMLVDPERGLGYLDEAENLANAAREPALLAALRWNRGALRDNLGLGGLDELRAARDLVAELSTDDQQRLAGRMMTLVAMPIEHPVLPRLSRHLASLLFMHGSYARAHAEIGEILLRATATERTSMPEMYSASALSNVMLGRVVEARDAFGEARALFARQPRQLHLQELANSVRGELLLTLSYAADDLDERRRIADEVERLYAEIGSLGQNLSADISPRWAIVPLLIIEGGWDESWEICEQCRRAGEPWRTTLAGAHGQLARLRGQSELAWTLIKRVVPRGPAAEPGATLFFAPTLPLLRLAAALALDADESNDARDWIEAHARWRSWSGGLLWQAEEQLLWSRYFRHRRDVTAAVEWARAALQTASNPRQPLALLAARRALGSLALDAGDAAIAESHLRQALALADACGAPYERALTLLGVAELRMTTAVVDGARDALDEAHRLCVALNAAQGLHLTGRLKRLLAAS